MTERLSALRRNFDDWQVDGLLITGAANRRWTSGFTGSFGRLLITRHRAILFTDSRYWEQAERQATHFSLYRYRDQKDDMLNFLKEGGVSRIGIEARNVTLAEREALGKVDGYEWVALPATAEPLRAVKSADELAAIRAAARLTDDTVAQMPYLARPGLTERAVAWELEKHMRDAGADRTAFDIIVASGPNSALPHHRPGDRVLAAGDIIIVDLGAEVGGYKSDLTRTFYLGSAPDDRFWEIYNTVHNAHQTAIGGIRPGVTGKAVDSLARDLIAAAGHGDHFGHGTGHGVGLDIHEEPRFSRLSEETIIPAGAVMTVEPGIYLPGYGGVRIEDLMLVTDAGAEYLSAAEKSPLILV